MKKIALEDLALDVIVSFCENAAELGCPREKDVDMWIRELAMDKPKEARKVMDKLFTIIERPLNDAPVKKANRVKKADIGDQITRDWIKGLSNRK